MSNETPLERHDRFIKQAEAKAAIPALADHYRAAAAAVYHEHRSEIEAERTARGVAHFGEVRELIDVARETKSPELEHKLSTTAAILYATNRAAIDHAELKAAAQAEKERADAEAAAFAAAPPSAWKTFQEKRALSPCLAAAFYQQNMLAIEASRPEEK